MSIDEPAITAADRGAGPNLSAGPSGRARDLLAAALALAIGASALWGTSGMSNLGSVFPTTAAAVLIGTAILLAARSLLRRPTSRPEASMPPRAEWWRLVAVAAILLLWALLLKPAGFLLTATLGMLALGPVVMREPMTMRAVLLHLAAAAILILGFWLLMVRVLRLAVPAGIFG